MSDFFSCTKINFGKIPTRTDLAVKICNHEAQVSVWVSCIHPMK